MRSPSSAGNTRGLIEATSAAVAMACSSSLPRGIPAASLKLGHHVELSLAKERLPRGIPAASLKLGRRPDQCADLLRLPRGIPAASLKRLVGIPAACHPDLSSAGNTRGLIEACGMLVNHRNLGLKSSAGNTRGLIEARESYRRPSSPWFTSSAGNTRGLIEARRRTASRRRTFRLPRGIPAASLKLLVGLFLLKPGQGLPRGIPAASLKQEVE